MTNTKSEKTPQEAEKTLRDFITDGGTIIPECASEEQKDAVVALDLLIQRIGYLEYKLRDR